MSTPQPQAKPNNKSDQTTSTTNSTQITWETILRSPRIEKEHIDFALSHINDAPQVPTEFVYNQLVTDVKILPPASIAVSGAGGVIGAFLALKYARQVVNFVTTQEVLDANEKSPLYLSKYALERLSKTVDAQIIILKLNEFEKIKLLLKEGGFYISGLPNEIIIEIAQLAGFGRLWHFSPINKKFYVF